VFFEFEKKSERATHLLLHMLWRSCTSVATVVLPELSSADRGESERSVPRDDPGAAASMALATAAAFPSVHCSRRAAPL
jgi:hypothetical protein